jgi:hypothetical protein
VNGFVDHTAFAFELLQGAEAGKLVALVASALIALGHRHVVAAWVADFACNWVLPDDAALEGGNSSGALGAASDVDEGGRRWASDNALVEMDVAQLVGEED